MIFTRAVAVLALLLFVQPAFADDELTLFNGRGEATAYVAVSDDMTIYTWSGKPVAYLENSSGGGFDVYGFNGKHLGWFLKGIIWDHAGGASCAVKEALQTTQFEPFKSFKQFKPFKTFKEFAPLRPLFSNSFGDTPCRLLLSSGGE